MTSTRSYRAGYDLDHAVQILREGAGRVTDPYITDTCINLVQRLVRERPADFVQRFTHIMPDNTPAPPAAHAGSAFIPTDTCSSPVPEMRS